jgi:hypothetical protein
MTPPAFVIGGAALVSAIALLAVTRVTVNQTRLADARRAFVAALKDLRPFRSEISGVWAGLGRLIRANVRYARLALFPVLILALPLAALFAHLDSRYGEPGVSAGQSLVVTMRASNGAPVDAAGSEPRLSAQDGIRIETPAVWIPSLRESSWRIVPDRPGEYDLTATIGVEVVRQHLVVSDPAKPTSPIRSWPVEFVALSMIFTLVLQRPFGVRLV